MSDKVSKQHPRRIYGRVALIVAGIGGVSVALLYLNRTPIAEHFVDAELAKRGVRASYRITRLDPYHQRLENVVIGDPAHPDLTADWIELSTHIGLGSASVDQVSARGVRLRGALDRSGNLHFGALDKFRTAGPGPFSLPDIKLDLTDARLALTTPYGNANARIDGSGNLAQDFSAQLLVDTSTLAAAGCAAAPMKAYLDFKVQRGVPHLDGPVHSDSVTCAGTTLSHPELRPDVTFTSDFKGARGTLWMLPTEVKSPVLGRAAQALTAANGTPLAPFGTMYRKAILELGNRLEVNLTFAHDPAQGSVVSAFSARSHPNDGVGAALTMAKGGHINITPAGRITFDGQALLNGGGFPDTQVTATGSPSSFQGGATIAPLTAPETRLALTPVTFSHDPRGTRFLTTAVFDGGIAGAAVRGLALPVAGTIDTGGGFVLTSPCTPIRFEALTFNALSLGKSAATICINGKIVRINAPQFAGKYGQQPLNLAAANAQYDLASKSLNLVQAHGSLGATRLAVATATYDAARGALDLSWLAGQTSAATFTASNGQYNNQTGQFSVRHVTAQAGSSSEPSRLVADSLTGVLKGSTASGRYTNASGHIASVPLALTNSAGTWRYAGGAVSLSGVLDVADSDAARRFEPLVSRDVSLRYADDIIIASGTLHEPKKGAFVAKVNIRHNVKTTTGAADILIKDMPLLSFGKALQPDALTRIAGGGTLANVYGAISGAGHIHWTNKGVTSDGEFDTNHMDLFSAAAGQIYGLKGRIVFTDLLGMVTAPNQVVTMASVNPGVIVNNGEIRYRLLPGNKVEIEGGTFPLAGGQLVIEPTVLDLSESAERRMTFRVDGVDAGKFLNDYKFEDVSATGIFDGTLPLVFNVNGARIESGRLAVRDAGGVVSYVGPVSNASLGKFGKLAFDALKSIKYRGLTIDLNGPLDGEMVTLVKLSGTNQVPLSGQKSYFLKQITGIPFKFNIQIRAPFRSLFNTAKNLQDPSDLVQQTLPKNLKASAAPSTTPPAPLPVHPADSSVQK